MGHWTEFYVFHDVLVTRDEVVAAINAEWPEDYGGGLDKARGDSGADYPIKGCIKGYESDVVQICSRLRQDSMIQIMFREEGMDTYKLLTAGSHMTVQHQVSRLEVKVANTIDDLRTLKATIKIVQEPT